MRSEFEVHMLNDSGKSKAADIAEAFSLLLARLELPEFCGKDGRDVALVRTHLEDACFRAKRAMASQKANQA